MRAAAHRDAAAARSIRVPNAAAPDDRPAGRKIGALDVLRQALDVDRGVLDHGNDSVDHLTEVVRWHVRRHADRDPGRTVDEQVGKLCRQHQRLLQGAVIIRHEIDGFLLYVGQQLIGQPGHANLGIPHGRGVVPVHRAKVSLPVDQRIAE